MNKYESLVQKPSDINEHLEIIKHYSSKVNSVVEFGVREVVSTWAILEGLSAGGKYIGVDIHESINIIEASNYAKNKNIDFNFIKNSTLDPNLKIECEFLFIDTLHTFNQLTSELLFHGNSPTKYLAFHDVVSFAYNDQIKNTQTKNTGLLPAIFYFLKKNPHWVIDYFAQNNNGFLVLKRN